MKTQIKSEIIPIRFNPEQTILIQKLAEKEALAVSTMLRQMILNNLKKEGVINN